MPDMYLIRGVSGSGKSTLAQQLANALRCTWWEADEYFTWHNGEYLFNPLELPEAHKWCFGEVAYEVRNGRDVIVCNTFTKETDLQEYLDLANDFGYRVFSMVVEHRHRGENVHNVPEHVIQRQESQLKDNLKLV